MKLPAHAEIVVIGGGIIGCSTAYHLARDHKADVVLLEQGKLTSGSTWHAAGLVGQLRSSASITRVLKYSVDLYKGLEAETGLATGWKMTGCLRLATNADRWIEYKRLATTAKSFGMDMQLLSPAEVKTMWPLLEAGDLVGASWLPTDGQASPSDITQSLAKGARMHGARLFEDVRVTGFDMKDGRITAVKTNKGDIACGKVVNCAGQWARQVGALAGINVPLQPVKHQYIVTERIDGLATDAPTIRDPDRRIYFKEEVGGLVMGGYEPNPQAWTTDLPGGDVPDDWEFRLFDDDYDHFEQHMNQAIARVPALETVGVKQMINGPESFTPDGNFILGVAPECANMFVGAGFNAFGIAAGGGAGWVLAQWVVDGEAPLDLWVVDIRRFSDLHRDRQWVRDRTLEAYGKHYTIGFPHEEYVTGRPRIVSPLYERLQKHRAVFGSKLGWERPNWFAKPVGRLTYTQLLNTRGGIEADLTVARLGEERFYVVTGTGFRTHDFSWIGDHVGSELDVTLTDVTEDFGTLSLMGPRARDVLAAVTDADVSNTAFPFGHVREISVAGHTVRALRVTYVGELGWELHVPIAATGEIFDALMAAGEEHSIRPVGYRALESLRLEKGYRAWGSDITPNDTPQEAGLGWAAKLRKNTDFLGRRALESISGGTPKKRFAGFTVDDCEIVLLGRETILRNNEPVGYLTSGGYGYTVGKNIGYGYVRNADGVSDDFLTSGDYELVVAMERTPAKIHLEPLYDPAGARIRA
ncbi:MAG: FAD-dependent oxidoreductase [Mesorhizobium sp.]|uniref:GcvT family protein n=1 Tax=Mesorhizobium sp. TaxID=1871066 RepID=UPI000FE783BC|nr:FAD-dependent oxidoreductase [Mesorhizobium sp.]RWF85164.1 MAG: FAD-dependent oxidoreductase [Mesorhizobium sp.]